MEEKIPSITGLAITSDFSAIEKRITNVSDLVNKTDDDVEISDIETIYFTTSDYNEFTSEILHAKTKQKGLDDKSNISNLVKNLI